MSLTYEIQLFCLGITFASLIFMLCMLYINNKENTVKPKYCYLVKISKDGKYSIEKSKMKEVSDYVITDSKNNSYYVKYEMEK